MGTERRKFWSKRTIAYIVGMTIAVTVSDIVSPAIGISNNILHIIVTVICAYVFITILELILTMGNTT